MKEELKETIKIELSQMTSHQSPPIEENIQVFGACVSIKGSCAKTVVNPLGEEHVIDVMPTIRLHVQDDHSTRLVAVGKVYEGASTIHNMPYVDDVVKVSVAKVYDDNAQVPFPMSKVQYVRQTLDTFIAWPRQLVKHVSRKVFIYV